MVKVGMLSAWHVHTGDYAKSVLNTGLAEITALWDDDEARGKKAAERIGCPYYSDLDEFFSKVEAVVCDAPTTKHKELIIKAAKAGKHVFTEKAMAPTVAECEEMADVIEKAGITFTVSLPGITGGLVRKVKQMIDNGEFGKISLIRNRNGHDGVSGGFLPDYWFNEDDTAGGALMDLGCHPMYTANYLLGKPKRVSAIMTNPCGRSHLDEAASVTIEFENGAVFTGETSFVTYLTPHVFEVYGTEASLVCVGGYAKFFSKAMEPYTGKEGVTLTAPDGKPAPIVQFIEACYNGTGTPEDLGPRNGVELTRLLENAYISQKENKTVVLD